MGYTKARVILRNPREPSRQKELELVADTGAIYTIVPRKELRILGIEPMGSRKFRLADGRLIKRPVGIIEIQVRSTMAHSMVVFGANSDVPLLGVTALEELGLQVDPISGKLKPLELLLL